MSLKAASDEKEQRRSNVGFALAVVAYTLIELSAIWTVRFALTWHYDKRPDWSDFLVGFLPIAVGIFAPVAFRLTSGTQRERQAQGAMVFAWVFATGMILQFPAHLSIALSAATGAISIESGALIWINQLKEMQRSLETLAREPQSPARRIAAAALYAECRIWLVVVLTAFAAMAGGTISLYSLIEQHGDSPLSDPSSQRAGAAAMLLLASSGLILLPVGVWVAEPTLNNLARCRNVISARYVDFTAASQVPPDPNLHDET